MNEEKGEQEKVFISFQTFDVKTEDGRRKQLIIRTEITEAYNNKEIAAFVPRTYFKFLDSVDNEKYKGRCTVEVYHAYLILHTQQAMQRVNRLDAKKNAESLDRKESELERMTSEELIESYLESIGHQE